MLLHSSLTSLQPRLGIWLLENNACTRQCLALVLLNMIFPQLLMTPASSGPSDLEIGTITDVSFCTKLVLMYFTE
jgi:hypothetical protein